MTSHEAEFTPLEKALARTLGVGRRNAIKQADLADRLNTGTRRIQEALLSLTEKTGLEIVSPCTPPYGTFIAETEEELEEYLQQQESRARSGFYRVALLRRNRAQALADEMQASLPVENGEYCRLCEVELTGKRTDFCCRDHRQEYYSEARRQGLALMGVS